MILNAYELESTATLAGKHQNGDGLEIILSAWRHLRAVNAEGHVWRMSALWLLLPQPPNVNI